MLPVVSQLTSPPVVGKYYLVPAVYMQRESFKPAIWWPVHGSLHNDTQFFNFELQHYHVDQRFLTRAHLTYIGNFDDIRGWGPLQRSFAAPVHGTFAHIEHHPRHEKLPPKPELRRMRCMREMPELPPAFQGTTMHAHFAGQTAKRGRLGLVCPHQQYPLGQSTPDADGIITCPLHGLRIRARDGRCMGAATNRAEATP